MASVLGVLFVCCIVAVPGLAQFSEPALVSSGRGQVTDSTMAFDLANNAYIVSVVDEKLRIDLIGPDLRATRELPGEGFGQSQPSIATGSVGEAFIAFSQADTSPVGIGRDIYLTHNGGGRFVEPEKISDSLLDEFTPSLVLDSTAETHVVWVRGAGRGRRRRWARRGRAQRSIISAQPPLCG